MEFYEFFEKIASYIPNDYVHIKQAAEALLPWLFGFFTLATSFFGNFVQRIWDIFFFFGIGFFVPLLIIFALLEPSGIIFWTIVIICVAIGVLCAIYSHHLHKIKLFVTTLFMVYIAVSGYVIGLGTALAILIGIAVAITAAILAIKYKYLTVLATTAFSGSMMFWDMIEAKFTISHTLVMILAIVVGVCGLAVQCVVEKETLKETYNEVKDKSEKVKDKVTNK